MKASTIATITATNIAIQNAMRSSNSSGTSTTAEYPAPVVIATICLFLLACIVSVPLVQFVLEHPVISAVILIAAVVLCAVWYGTCY